jgi:predicted CopG family antitoxin
MDRKANLFMVGAMKAGTTSFMDVISQHPQIYVSPIKEPNYFISELPEALYDPSRFFSIEKYFQNDFPNPLHIAHVKNAEDYDRLFTLQKGEKYISEGSTMYLHAPQTAQRIHEYNPNAKIIIITRDPLNRSFSQYRMLVGLSKETKSFQDVLSKEITQYKNGDLAWNSYLGMSFYDKAINQYKELFQEVCIISFEDLVNHGEETLQKIVSFLKIDDFKALQSKDINPTRSLRFKWLFFLLKKIGLKDYFSIIFGRAFKQKVFQWASKSGSEPMNLSEATRQKLEEIFKKESHE